MQELSLLDWLKLKLTQPRHQRFLRFGLAGAVALWGIYAISVRQPGTVGGYVLVGLALGLLFWGLAVRGSAASTPEMPALVLSAARAAPLLSLPTVSRRIRLPSALVLALLGQATLTYNPTAYPWGLLLYALGVGTFVASLWREGLPATPQAESLPAAEGFATALRVRGWPLAIAILAGVYTFVASGGNQFRADGVAAWAVSILAWMAAVWEWPPDAGNGREWLARRWESFQSLWRAESLNLRLTRQGALLVLVLIVGAYFRFVGLDTIPPEMTSDHVEKLLDVNDLISGQHKIFFERNTGREPLQFYFAALVIRWLGTGLTHLTLKITSAVAGLALLPFVYLLGREVEDEGFGLLATLLAAISFWATSISRIGLRFPLTPLFVAPVLWLLLLGLRRGKRNDFLLAGLFLGAGLYGYSTIRVLPLVLLLAVAWHALRRPRAPLFVSTVLLFATAFVVFMPLFRYATEEDSYFWDRTLSRLGETENQIPGSVLRVFVENQWNGVRMFNWLGDDVWVNTIPGAPALDFISGALFIAGVAYLLARLIWRGDRLPGLLLLAIPILILPSTLSLAFPEENPSVVRAAGALPIVFLVAAYPPWLLYKNLRAAWPEPSGPWVSVLVVGGLMAGAAAVNHRLYFVRYLEQYLGAAQNASEIGEAVRGFASSIGSFETSYICLHPHWADTRAVGIYAGRLGWEQVMPPDGFAGLRGDPRPKLIVVNPGSQECLSALRDIFPEGQVSVHHSARSPDQDFLLFYVAGIENLEENTLTAP